MRLKKIGPIKARTIIKGENNQDTDFIFYSYDKGSAALEFLLKNQQNEVMDLTNTTVKFLFIGTQEGVERKFTYLDSQPIIESQDGRIIYPLPDKLLNYEGEVNGYLYLDFEDGSHSDQVSFTFTIIRSKIDETLEEVNDIYIKDFEQVRNEVFEKAEQVKEAIESIQPEIESSIQAMTSQIENIHETLVTEHKEVERLIQLIDSSEILTLKDFLASMTRGYFEFEKELNFHGKIARSFVENPNDASMVTHWQYKEGIFQMPTPYSNLALMDTYPTPETSRQVIALNGGVSTGSSISGGKTQYHSFMRIQWDVVETIRRWLGDEYYLSFNAETMEQRVELAEKGLCSIYPLTRGYAYHRMEDSSRVYGLTSQWYDNQSEKWNVFGRHESKTLQTIEAQIEKEENVRFLDNKGRVNILLIGDKGMNPALTYQKATLKIAYRIYLSDIVYYKKDREIARMQTQIQQLWDKVFNQ